MADDRRDNEEFEQITNDRDRERRESEEVVGQNNEEFEDVDELEEDDDNLSEGSE